LIARITISLLLYCCMLQPAQAQSCKTSATYINNVAVLRDTMRANPLKRLVPIQAVAPSIHIALAYATSDNFTHTVLYHNATAYMLSEPAKALARVQDELHKKDLGLKVFDAFRPFSVTCLIWNRVHDVRYAADPAKGSNHNRGLAVDITIIDLKTGKELDMGSGFDNFSDTAHHDFMELPTQVLANRRLLKQVLDHAGFSSLPTEWWHYQWRTLQHFDIIDLDFDQLGEALKD
jgi:D-alanyl-D-alanine dipeptidase